MPAYRLYRLDGAGKIMNADWIEAEGDQAALDAAQDSVGSAAFELWDRGRLVGGSAAAPEGAAPVQPSPPAPERPPERS